MFTGLEREQSGHLRGLKADAPGGVKGNANANARDLKERRDELDSPLKWGFRRFPDWACPPRRFYLYTSLYTRTLRWDIAPRSPNSTKFHCSTAEYLLPSTSRLPSITTGHRPHTCPARMPGNASVDQPPKSLGSPRGSIGRPACVGSPPVVIPCRWW